MAPSAKYILITFCTAQTVVSLGNMPRGARLQTCNTHLLDLPCQLLGRHVFQASVVCAPHSRYSVGCTQV